MSLRKFWTFFQLWGPSALPCPALLLHGWRQQRNGAQQPFRPLPSARIPPGVAGASSALQYPGKGKAEPAAPAGHVISCHVGLLMLQDSIMLGLDSAFHTKIKEHTDWLLRPFGDLVGNANHQNVEECGLWRCLGRRPSYEASIKCHCLHYRTCQVETV